MIFDRARIPSPALVISIIALVAALGGGYAIAKGGGDKKSDKKIANKQITKRAPNLSVKSAGSANTADSANPLLFAHVNADGTVDGSLSKGVTGANVTTAPPGVYCFTGISGGIRGLQASVDYTQASADETAQVGVGDGHAGCAPGTQAWVATFTGDGTGTFEDHGIYVHLYR